MKRLFSIPLALCFLFLFSRPIFANFSGSFTASNVTFNTNTRIITYTASDFQGGSPFGLNYICATKDHSNLTSLNTAVSICNDTTGQGNNYPYTMTGLNLSKFSDVAINPGDSFWIVTNGFQGNYAWSQELIYDGPPYTPPPPPPSIDAGETFLNTDSFTDSSSTSWTATVDYGDGSGVNPLTLTGQTYSLNHAYYFPGTYTLSVNITNDQNNTFSKAITLIVHPNHSIDFAISYFSSGTFSNPLYPVLSTSLSLPEDNLATCSLIDNDNNTIVDTALTQVDSELGLSRITLNIPNKNTPANWPPAKGYHFNCIKINNETINSNDFQYYPVPAIDTFTQNGSIITVQLLPYKSGYVVGTDHALRAPGWFDDLGHGICEEISINTIYSSPTCHFDFLINPGLPSTNKVYLPLDFSENNVTYSLGTTDLMILSGISNTTPNINSLNGGVIIQEEPYVENGTFHDYSSYNWTATVDYGDGSGTNPLSLNDMGFSLNHQYSSPGMYTVTIKITDDQGAVGTKTTSVTVNPLETPTPTPVQLLTFTLNPTADTYVRSGQSDRNQGGDPFMRIQSSGNNRAFVHFDQQAIASTVGSGTVLSAKLRVTITNNGNNWGTTGRTVDVHRLTSDWAEGNGTENNRGTGSGATWSCAIDSVIQNQAKNCSGTTEWEMGQPNNPSVHPWITSPSATQTITNNQSGVVEYDITSDVSSFLNGTSNYGWIIKKTNEGQNGQIDFGTKESNSTPQLIVTYQP